MAPVSFSAAAHVQPDTVGSLQRFVDQDLADCMGDAVDLGPFISYIFVIDQE